MKIVLLYPGITSLGFNSYGIGAEESWIHHGLCSLSACLKLKGYSVELIDLRRLTGWKQFKKEIEKRNPDIVGITMMSVDFDPAIRSAYYAKMVNSEIVTILGGPHPSIAPEEVARFKCVDYVMRGEGEISLVKLIDRIKEKNLPREKILVGETPNLDEIPFVDRELFKIEEQPWWLLSRERPFVTIISARGCYYNCSFCQPAERLIFGSRVRRRSVDNVIKELMLLQEKYRFKSFAFHDDNLIENPQWVEEFCEKYIKSGFKQKFIFNGRADLICKYPELMKKLKEAGAVGLSIGFESGNQRILDLLRKRTTVEQNLKAAEICRQVGLKVQANYMIGIPTETKQEVMDTIRMVEKINPELHGCAIYTPTPGSDLYEFCKKNNMLKIKSYADYRRDLWHISGEKIKGVDYRFLTKISEYIKEKNLSFTRKFMSRVVRYLVRKNRYTLWFIKLLCRNVFIRDLAHQVVSRINV